jgi:hypothetical protein
MLSPDFAARHSLLMKSPSGWSNDRPLGAVSVVNKDEVMAVFCEEFRGCQWERDCLTRWTLNMKQGSHCQMRDK